MRKFKFILYLLCLLSVISLTSCKNVSQFNNQDYGKIKYYVAGLYIQVNEYDEFTMDDPNPKLYFDFSNSKKFGTLVTKSGALNSAVTLSNLAKNTKVEDDTNKYYMNGTIRFVNSEITKINLYIIYIDNEGNFSINEELSETVKCASSTSYNFVANFTNNKEKYQIQMKLFINK